MSSHPHMRAQRRSGHRCLPLPRAVALAMLALALSGCAGQMAYREGHQLLAQDKVEAGLLKYQEAMAADPANARFKASFLQARERSAMRYLVQADRDLADGRAEPALQAYRRVLEFDPVNERARAGMRAIEMDTRHAAAMREAAAAVEKKDYEPARQKLSGILTERPGFEPARALLREVSEKTAVPAAETGLALAYRQPVTIEFREAPLKQVFEVIARRSGLNFVFDKDVKSDQRTSIMLKNSTVEAAIHYLLVTNHLEQQVMDGNTILIYPNIPGKLKEYQEMVIKTFFLANADAKSVANTLKTILKSRDVVVDEKLNLVILRDNVDAVRLAEKLVALQDVAEPEVIIEVEILEIKRSRLMELGIAWPSAVTLAPLVTKDGGPLNIANLRNLNSTRIGISGVSATINANKTDGDTNILANPRIRVRNKEKAKVLIGEKVPNITTTISPGSGGFASESVNYVDVGLTLNVEPTIYLNNEVAIRVALEVSNLVGQLTTKSGTVAYQIGTRQASTMLQLKDGENQVLAGLINNEDRSTGSKVPLAGDLPILGRLFGSTLDDKQKTEIVLSITPHLVRNIQRPAASASEFSAGTESHFRRRPDASPRAPAVLPAAPAIRPALLQALPARPAPQLPVQLPAPAGEAPSAQAAIEPVALPETEPVPAPVQQQ